MTRAAGARALLAPLACLALATAATAAPVRTAVPRDDAGHTGGAGQTEWWFANAIDPRTGLGVALSLGADMPSGPPATVVFLYPPGGGAHVLGALRPFGREVDQERAGVRLGPDEFRQVAPGVWRVRVDMPGSVAIAGDPPGPVRIDLVLRSRTPGFVAGPLPLGGGQSMSWTVAAPRARASGTVRIGERAFRLRGAPAYHDHNFGPFDLSDPAHGGWDWSQAHLPGGRSLALGLLRPADRPERGVAVLSAPGRRLAATEDVRVTRSRWARSVGGRWYPSRVGLVARAGNGWTVRLGYRALRAAPLPFDARGDSALVEVLARADGELRRDGRLVARVRAAPAFYEYESTPLTRMRDRAPGTPGWVGALALRAARGLSSP